MTTPRAHPTPRKEGMNNILEATIRLLQDHSPAEVTLHEIARESGHSNRVIIEWFGSKGGLFAAVFEKIFGDLAASGYLFYSGVATRSDIRIAVRVFNYMQMHHNDVVEQFRHDFVLTRLVDRFTTVLGFTPERALLVARRIALLVMGIAIFSDFLDFTDEEIIDMTKNEYYATTGLVLPDVPFDVPPTTDSSSNFP